MYLIDRTVTFEVVTMLLSLSCTCERRRNCVTTLPPLYFAFHSTIFTQVICISNSIFLIFVIHNCPRLGFPKENILLSFFFVINYVLFSSPFPILKAEKLQTLYICFYIYKILWVWRVSIQNTTNLRLSGACSRYYSVKVYSWFVMLYDIIYIEPSVKYRLSLATLI